VEETKRWPGSLRFYKQNISLEQVADAALPIFSRARLPTLPSRMPPWSSARQPNLLKNQDTANARGRDRDMATFRVR
jgi:hypothetical protein